MSTSPRDTFDSKQALSDALAFNSRDFSERKLEAWIYGIILGWGDKGDPDNAWDDVAENVGWDAQDVARCQGLHEHFKSLTTPEPTT